MSPMPAHQAAAYAAENVALDGVARKFRDLPEVVAYLDRLFDRPEFEELWPNARLDEITVNTRARRSTGGRGVINLASLNMASLLHELAHVLAPEDAGHGTVWRQTFLALVKLEMGFMAYGALQQAYKERGL